MRVRAIYRDKILKPKRKLALAEGEEVTIEIRKSKVDKLAGLLGDIEIDSVNLQHLNKKFLTLESLKGGKYAGL
jgi:predicted DNA-binding antitoxin AbrB/MazE fold protein